MARAFGHDDRIRIRWIVRLTPLADVSVCILAHLIASFADVYPIPVSPATVCVPGCWISTPQVRSFVKFNFANWASWPSQFVIFGRVDREISCDVRATPGAQHYGNQSNYRRLWLDNAEMWRSHGSPQVPTHRGQALHVLHQPLLLCDGDVISEEHQGG